MKPLSQKHSWINPKLVVFTLIVFCSVSLNVYLVIKDKKLMAANENEKMVIQDNSCSMDIVRGKYNNGEFVKPLLLAEINSESAKFTSLKIEINKLIEQRKQKGDIQSVSVYLRDLNSTSWIDIGDINEYYPGSLMKVPIMMYYLKQEQDHPGTLQKEFQYIKPRGEFPAQTYRGDSIIPGKKYPVAVLLKYMIAESDNNATFVLATHIDRNIYQQLYSDLDIPYSDISDAAYTISPRQYSKFFRVLYSTTYLNKGLSNYALKLLAECNFKAGLVKDLPSGTVVAHKFGEREFDRNEMDFSESGIIYYNSQPYLLTIMTRGRNVIQQTSLVRELSNEIFNQYKNI